MTLRLLIEPEAEAELEEAADRYEESVPGLGLEFLSEMRERTRDVLEAPHRYPPFGGVEGIRVLVRSMPCYIISASRKHSRWPKPKST